MKTKQIVFTKPYTAELLDVEYESPMKNEVTVELEYSAISAGTEKANFIGMRNGITVGEDEQAVFPRYVGYSAAGIVKEVGDSVNDIKVGDRVIVYWGKHKKCITVSRNNVVKIPEGVSTKEASMALISTFPLAAIRKTKLEIGESALVMGLGILGIFAVQELRAAGAYPIIAADSIAERREFALRMGADYALDPTEPDFTKKVISLSGNGCNVCIEVTGLGVGLVQALDCMKEMGRVALLGCTRSSKFEIDYYGKVHGRGISLIGAHTIARPKHESSAGLWTDEDDLKAILALIKGKRLDFEGMICELYSPVDAQEVYTRLANEKNFPIGVLFDWSLA
ncbi:MAG: zinc-binding alcohol dehydrogenase [Ruminococcaceae bacterium]|nr:zinc-binding alcohol dehydrogenase [Oscillospiraceae bacterium]